MTWVASRRVESGDGGGDDGRSGSDGRSARAGDHGDSGVNWSYHVATSKRRVARVTASRDSRPVDDVIGFIYVTNDQPTTRVRRL